MALFPGFLHDIIYQSFCMLLVFYNTTNVKNMHLHGDSNPGPWNTYTCLLNILCEESSKTYDKKNHEIRS